ncbi:hypothetical protein CVR96_26220, partial [Salmonella enterica subsp. enterica serovar Typhimurium]|uniref:HK97-gp10 family putative phage morphogenesis protein n=1 Tax=Salmonella enterica TaxID=28901 RepID=UPI000C223869
VAEAVANNGSEMQRKAINRAPVGTGNLKRKIELDVDRSGFTATVTPETEYAMYPEYGTGVYAENNKGRKTPWTYYNEKVGHYVTTIGMMPQPFLRPAFHEQKYIFLRDIARLLRD